MLPEPSDDFPYVLFLLDGKTFGVSSRLVLSMYTYETCTPMAASPYYVRGITNFRGSVIPLCDMRVLLGITPYGQELCERAEQDASGSAELDAREIVIVLECEEMVFGLIVDRIVAVEPVTELTDQAARVESPYLSRLGKRSKDNSIVFLIEAPAIAMKQ